MSLIMCPECGAKISDKALECPRCGYGSDDRSLPISSQEKCLSAPLGVGLESLSRHGNIDFALKASDDWERLLGYLTAGERFVEFFPVVSENVKQILHLCDSEYVAKLTPELRRLVNEGCLSFKLDKNGEIMAILQNQKGKIANQIRLEKTDFETAKVQSISNLATMAFLNQIMDEIQEVREMVERLSSELQDDRLAIAESSKDKLFQADKIKSPELRANAILLAIGTATESKRQLMRHFLRSRTVIEGEGKKGFVGMLLDRPGKGEALASRADSAMEDLSLISTAVQVECFGWSMLGESEALQRSLDEFGAFVRVNKLDSRETLLTINENTDVDWSCLAEGFSCLLDSVDSFSRLIRFGDAESVLLNSGDKDERTI